MSAHDRCDHPAWCAVYGLGDPEAAPVSTVTIPALSFEARALGRHDPDPEWTELTTEAERRAAHRTRHDPPPLTRAPIVVDGVKSRVLGWWHPSLARLEVRAELRDGRIARVLGYDSIAAVFRGELVP